MKIIVSEKHSISLELKIGTIFYEKDSKLKEFKVFITDNEFYAVLSLKTFKLVTDWYASLDELVKNEYTNIELKMADNPVLNLEIYE